MLVGAYVILYVNVLFESLYTRLSFVVCACVCLALPVRLFERMSQGACALLADSVDGVRECETAADAAEWRL